MPTGALARRASSRTREASSVVGIDVMVENWANSSVNRGAVDSAAPRAPVNPSA
jgi:hypothetical protein